MYFALREPSLEPIELGGEAVTYFIRSTDLRDPEIQRVGDELLELVQWQRAVTAQLDFTPVEYLTAAVLGKLVALHATLRDMGRRLVLTNLSEQLYEVFAVTRLTRLLDIRRPSPWRGPHVQMSA